MSCNGCRILRKGCDKDCTLRPCLQRIQTPESQANATLFLAKFYGRAGLLNLINAAPPHLRPAVFRSLLYDACGRIINPIYGSVGLMWSGNWHHCQAAARSGVCPRAKSDFVSKLNGEPSHDSFYVETEEASLVKRAEPERAMRSGTESEDSKIVLELRLGVYAAACHYMSTVEDMEMNKV
ncbi:hypothetical protein LguiA_032458 [Lonicera macranthoides]